MVSKGKWTKHRFLRQNQTLLTYLPETKLFSEKTLVQFLEQYGEAIVKPSRGSLGKRIFKITDRGNEHYEIHGGNQKEIVSGMKEAYQLIRDNVSKKKIIIQQVIPLARKDGYPYDVRVMLQKRKDTSEWFVTGTAAKVASKGFFITNAAREVLPVEEAIKHSTMKPFFMRTRRIMREMEKVSLIVAATLQDHYPTCKEFGIDIGIDDEGKLWIIEVNTRPMISIFKVLHDKSMLEEIVRIREEYET